MKKKVLGRGLGALMGDDAVSSSDAPYMHCAIGKISANKDQPRKSFKEAPLKELAASIKEKGIIEPLIVRRVGSGFELIAGERRLRASKLAGLKEVPIVIMDATDRESLELAIIENVQREDLNPLEEAEAYGNLNELGLSQEEIARCVGKERATVANYMRLLKLPIEVKQVLIDGGITMGHARAILSLSGAAKQRELLRKIVKKGLSVRATELIASLDLDESGGKSKPASGSGKTSPRGSSNFEAIESDLRDIFSTKVLIKERSGKGRVEIEFYSSEERERIVDLLKSI